MSAQVIAIDGPAYVGKSVIAKALSALTGYTYINTGHMYRALAKKAMDRGYHYDHRDSIIKLAQETKIEFIQNQEDWRTFVDGEDWTDRLKDYRIVLFSSKIAVIPDLRADLTAKQREFAKKKTILMEGRDIGSIVFPDARWKFFITANETIRALRLWKTLNEEEQKRNPMPEVFIPKIQNIDWFDKNRTIAPLIVPADAITYDNSDSPDAEEDARCLKWCLDYPDRIPDSKTIFYGEFVRGIHS